MTISRRRFLTDASAAGVTAMSGLGSALMSMPVSAAQTEGYKSLVCVFFLGGLDCHDTVFPFDQSSYDRYAEIRAPLLQQYAARSSGPSTRTRERLLLLNPQNAADFGDRQFALPEELSGIKSLFDDGQAAIIGNVGPLLQPVTQQDFEADVPFLPKRLFSHNDQQSTWMASEPEGAQFGWGGRFADAALTSGANSASQVFSTVTISGNDVFLTGQNARPYQVGLNGAPEIAVLRALEGNTNYQLLRDHFEAANFASNNLIERDIANAMSAGLATNEAFNAALANAPSVSTVFAQDQLGAQLRAVATAIAAREQLGMSRQVFFVGVGGFDTHSNQAQDLPALQQSIDAGLTSFLAAMRELGVSNDVTLFTASDFGRTLAINGDGTDHGWGGHHFVIGDAVQGNRIYGDLPISDFGHSFDSGSGRLIPTTSVEQYAAPLGRWFGLSDPELNAALPNLTNFSAPGLNFI